ncbi:carbohydrate ABC transporter permease [Paenibacillus nasutitermitis]|uniref:Sugar ABC transporter permease n=1 Tax=Paenibacillus nasutitermitis TaxID=1652958 RepID=A0A916ZE39_9BACL|nr:carbohydrate ABC transporter permease [Paenibacillus nasutitermitis]GGD89769.1 sugar ABC transporter permease [Paenibacillus nasutitermitis]
MVRRKMGLEDIFVDGLVYSVLLVLCVATIYPFYYSLIISFNEGIDATKGAIYLAPRKFSLENYEVVFANDQLMRGFIVTIARTIIGTIVSVFCTGLFAYSLTYKNLYFKKFYMAVIIVSMYFSGGLIPFFFLLKSLYLINTFWVYIIPGLIGSFNVLLMMSFFREIPESLIESARIDGAAHLRIFYKLVLPLSAPIFATIALFTAVGHWNSWFDAAYYTSDKSLKTISFWLMDLNNKVNFTSGGGSGQMDGGRSATYATYSYTAQTIRMAAMVIVIVPIVCVYPFLQKYFVKGIMLGSVKE